MLKLELDKRQDLQELLYIRGFFISSKRPEKMDEYPFYGNWKYAQIGKFCICHHKKIALFTYTAGDTTYYLIGHAYNPFTGEKDELHILKHLADLQAESESFWKYEATLTGVYVAGYVTGDTITHWVDCTGMLMSYYGMINGEYYCTSHSLLAAELCGLKEDPYITELKKYRFFKYFGLNLPGDLSPFVELKRCVPNHCYTCRLESESIKTDRFFPCHQLKECRNDHDYDILVDRTSDIMRKSMRLISEKWPDKTAAISVTGGKDSAMTLASAKEVYDRYQYFSYISEYQESVDAYAAHDICKALGLEHKIYEISEDDSDFDDIELYRKILTANVGNIGDPNHNDVRKRVFFLSHHDFEIEVKSWVDEIGRARYHKKYLKRHFSKKPTPRLCTSLYKAFAHNRKLVRETDKVFKDYINRYLGESTTNVMDWLTAFYWEFEWSMAEGFYLTAEHLFAYDITIPYNNRKIVELLLRPSLQYRIDDKLQQDVVERNNAELKNLNINIVDVDHTSTRALMERVYLEIHTHIPF